MCKLKSAIVLKNKVYMPFDIDSHTEMLKELGITDDYLGASKKFVRVEITPQDEDIFNQDHLFSHIDLSLFRRDGSCFVR